MKVKVNSRNSFAWNDDHIFHQGLQLNYGGENFAEWLFTNCLRFEKKGKKPKVHISMEPNFSSLSPTIEISVNRKEWRIKRYPWTSWIDIMKRSRNTKVLFFLQEKRANIWRSMLIFNTFHWSAKSTAYA